MLQACAVMALERVPADIRRDGGVARMSDPQVIVLNLYRNGFGLRYSVHKHRTLCSSYFIKDQNARKLLGMFYMCVTRFTSNQIGNETVSWLFELSQSLYRMYTCKCIMTSQAHNIIFSDCSKFLPT